MNQWSCRLDVVSAIPFHPSTHAPCGHVPRNAPIDAKEQPATRRHQRQTDEGGVEPSVAMAQSGADGRGDDLGKGVAGFIHRCSDG